MRPALLLAALLLGVGGAALAFSGPCGWAGRLAGDGGCLAAFTLRDLVVTGDTLATDAEGRLVVGGIDYRPGRRPDRLQAQMVVATLDLNRLLKKDSERATQRKSFWIQLISARKWGVFGKFEADFPVPRPRCPVARTFSAAC